jgi:hypothetical protein
VKVALKQLPGADELNRLRTVKGISITLAPVNYKVRGPWAHQRALLKCSLGLTGKQSHLPGGQVVNHGDACSVPPQRNRVAA